MSRIKIVATYTGDCTFEVRGRGISAGETSVKLLGATTAKASQQNITTAVVLLIPSSLADRGGMVVKNNNTSGTLYLGFTAAEAILSNGYPIGPKESLGLDVSSGVAVYVRSDVGTVDVRLLEGGG